MDIKSIENLKSVADSAEIFDACEKIGKVFNLHIDQIGQLDTQVRQILRGRADSKKFTNAVREYLEIDAELAKKITVEVNKEVFDVIKIKLQSQSPSEQSTISSLEHVGGFDIEHDALDTVKPDDVTSADRDQILNGLENPPHVGLAPANLPTGDSPTGSSKTAENHTEPLVDYLLSTPAGQSERKVTGGQPTTPPPTASNPEPKKIPAKPAGPDPYREAFK